MKSTRFLSSLLVLAFLCAVAPACSKKSGCPATESLKPKTNKKGEFVSKGKKKDKGLFPKKMAKKMKK